MYILIIEDDFGLRLTCQPNDVQKYERTSRKPILVSHQVIKIKDSNGHNYISFQRIDNFLPNRVCVSGRELIKSKTKIKKG